MTDRWPKFNAPHVTTTDDAVLLKALRSAFKHTKFKGPVRDFLQASPETLEKLMEAFINRENKMKTKMSLKDARLILQEVRYLKATEIVAKIDVDIAVTEVMVATADAAAAAIALVKATAVLKSIAGIAEAGAKLEESTEQRLKQMFPIADADYIVVSDEENAIEPKEKINE